jgi:putative transposase
MSQKRYATDLSDQEWAWLEPLIPAQKQGGRPRTTDMRAVCNAIFYQLKTGCQWAMLPQDFPAYSTVYFYYRRWQRQGVWEEMNRYLREQVRRQAGKAIEPTSVAIDSQSVKTTEKRGRCMALMAVSE